MENALKKKTDYWQVCFIVILVAGLPAIGKIASTQVNQTLVAAVYGAVGALVGYGLYAAVKNAKTVIKVVALIVEIGLLFGAVAFVSRYSSDDQVLRREWDTCVIDSVSFEYPNTFSEMKLDDSGLVCAMRAFSDNRTDRLAMYLIYDFQDSPVKKEDSLEGSVVNALTSNKATDIEFFDVNITATTVEAKFKYKIGAKDFRGFGFIYNEGNHFESVLFLPITKDYPDEYIERIRSSIKVRTED